VDPAYSILLACAALVVGAVAGLLFARSRRSPEPAVPGSRPNEGGPTIDIESRLPGTTGRVTYDIGTGVLRRYQLQTQSDGTTIDLVLQGIP